ncbi:transposase [Streptomyces roseus]|uniref:transposase n=1 Tax=Streptomyces roseus TaxID=66430 RepID=UPI00379AE809
MKPGRPRVCTRRRWMDSVRWRTRYGAPWRDVPELYGPWDRVYCLPAGSETGRGPGPCPAPGQS